MPGALDGLLVVSVEQAVAAPYCSARLADAGARVIKIERPEGDFARGYDGYVHGLSSYFVWLNRGKQSVTLDFKRSDDLALLHRLIGKADVTRATIFEDQYISTGGQFYELIVGHDRFPTYYGPELTAHALRDWCRFTRTETAFMKLTEGKTA